MRGAPGSSAQARRWKHAIAQFLRKDSPPPRDYDGLRPATRIQLAENGFDVRIYRFRRPGGRPGNFFVAEPQEQQSKNVELARCKLFPPDPFSKSRRDQRRQGTPTFVNCANCGSHVSNAAADQQVTTHALLQGMADTRFAIPFGKDHDTIPPPAICC